MTASETTTTATLTRDYVHPDYPEMGIEELRRRAAAFNLDDHLVALMFDEPFYSDVIRSLHKTATESITTAGVTVRDGILNLYWNPLFLAAYPNRVVQGVLMHESLHLCLQHTTTRRYEPHRAWNWATDLAINGDIREDALPPCGLRPGRPFPPPQGKLSPEALARYEALSKLVESLPTGLSAEEYFGILMESEDFRESMESGDGEGEGGHGSMDDHEGWDSLSDEEREHVAAKVRAAVKGAQERADASNRWGSVSESTRGEIRRRALGEVDWRSVLRHFVGTQQRSDRLGSVHRANRKYPGIHAGSTRDHRPSVGVFLDQSGSVSDSTQELFFGELEGLNTRVSFTLFNFDTEVDTASETPWSRGRPHPVLRRTRSGGTDFNAVGRFMKDSHRRFEAVIILTDGGAARPDPLPGVRRCWVLEPGTDLAWGETPRGDVLVKMKKGIPRIPAA